MDDNDQGQADRDDPLPTTGAALRGVVLHVEDSDDARAVMGVLLEAAGFAIHQARTAEAAMAQAVMLRDRLDVLIVDYNLGPGLTGTEVAEAIARMLGHGVPTVMLTGDPANAEVPWLLNSPVWLARKPLEPDALVAGLAPLVTFRRAISSVLRPPARLPR